MAAGLGFIEFQVGDILTAASANGYLASQTVMVFADSAARAAAITSPQEGMFTYLKDTNLTQYYSGSAYVTIGGASPLTTKGDLYTYSTADARLAVGANNTVLTADSAQATGLKWATPSAAGLTLVNRTNFSAVTSQSVNDVFSTTYDSYLLLINSKGDQTRGLHIRLRVGGADASGSDYNWHRDASFATTALNSDTTSTGYFEISQIDDLAEMPTLLTLANPFLAQKTGFNAVGGRSTLTQTTTGYHNLATSYTGFTIFLNSGTNNMTGSVSIYGYSK